MRRNVWRVVLAVVLIGTTITAANAVTGSLAPASTRYPIPDFTRHDADRDGVEAGADLCPQSPAGATVLARGCSALDIARQPGLFLQPAVDAIVAARQAVRHRPLLDGVIKHMDRGLAQLERAVPAVQKGHLCEGLTRVDEATASLSDAHALMTKLVPRLQTAAGAEHSPRTDDEHDGNTVPRVVAIGFVLNHVKQALEETRAADLVLRTGCAEVAGQAHVRGRIAAIDSATSRMQLDSGPWIGLPAGKYNFATDMEVEITGVAFHDGTMVANDVTILSGLGARVPLSLTCIQLRVAPVQGFAPFFAGPYTLHEPNAYRVGNRLLLEHGMGLAAAQVCPSEGPHGNYRSYSLKLDLEYTQEADLFFTTSTLAPDLGDGDHPVFLPADIDFGPNLFVKLAYAILRVTPRYRDCTPQGCGHLHSTDTLTYSLEIRPRGSLALARYDTTHFALEDDDVTGWRPARVLAVDPQFGVPAAGVHFSAQGCGIEGNSSSCDGGAFSAIHENTPFAIYNDVDQVLFPEQTRGTRQWSGLAWPRVAGMRNGAPFWYSVGVPALVRDVVDFCPSDPALHEYASEPALYRLPFYPGHPHWVVVNGTVLDANDHCDVKDGPDAPYSQCIQRWAYDFACDVEGRDIRAARGGIVSFVKDDETLPHGECLVQRSVCEFACGGQAAAACLAQCGATYPCTGGNHVFIKHQDDTYAQYSHLKGEGIFVQEGQVVHRGDVIGACGETGYASGPHLHFHVQPTPGFNTSLSIAARFQMTNKTCAIPRNGEVLGSTNNP